jgi:hypothetical protein
MPKQMTFEGDLILEGSGQHPFPHIFADKVEGVREQILEILSKDETVCDLVHEEVGLRFPRGVADQEGHLDEVVCMCQLLVYDRILKGVIK